MPERRIDLGSRHLDARSEGGVLRVRIDRPEKRNATTQEMYRGLKRAAILADADPEIDVLLVTGTGEWFGAGGDMSGASEDPEGLATELDPTDHFPFRHFDQCRKIVVAAVNGLCHAGGLDLVLWSDVSVASERASFRAPELLRGAPDPWLSARLVAQVGLARAKYMLFTAAVIGAAEAAAMGLVGRVVRDAEFDGHVEWVIQEIRRTAPAARALLKADVNRHLPPVDVSIFRRAIASPELAEGLRAFVEKRPPRWPRGA
jgi:enoyl-CoA hydratase/carnithine racemase